MSDFVQFEEELLAHHFKGTDFSCIFLRSKVDLSITTLANLSKYLEVTMTQSCTAFPKIGSLSAQVFLSCRFILFSGSFRRRRKLRTEESPSILTVVYVA